MLQTIPHSPPPSLCAAAQASFLVTLAFKFFTSKISVNLSDHVKKTTPLDISLWELCQNLIVLERENFKLITYYQLAFWSFLVLKPWLVIFTTFSLSQVDASFGLVFNLRFVWPPTCVDLCIDLRRLALTFGRAQIWTQVDASFLSLGHQRKSTQVDPK